MDLQEFKEKIPSFIDQAVEIGKNVPAGKADLEVSLAGIEAMDPVIDYLNNLWKKQLITDNVAWNASASFGVLLGEIIIREHGFHWIIDDDLPVVETEDGNRLSPITKLYKIITDEDNCEGSPSGFYDGFKALQQYYAMSDEEKERITTYIQPEQ